MEATNIYLTKHYVMNYAEKVTIMKNWLGREGMRYIKTLTKAEQEIYKNVNGLFDTLSEKLKQQHNETKLYL